MAKVDKMSISMNPDLGDRVREAADRDGKGLSAWLAEAAAAKLRAAALSDFLDEWEKQHGPITAEELAAAESEFALFTEPSR